MLTPTPFNPAMLMLSEAGAVFIGQGVAFDGVAMYNDLEGVPIEQHIEMPVAEELQLGIAIGMSMQGLLPVCVYPRLDFLMRAMDQLVNHLDKIEQMTRGQWRPRVIIRTRVGSRKPLDAGPQHTGSYAYELAKMLTNIDVFEIVRENDILATYRDALANERSSLIIENLC